MKQITNLHKKTSLKTLIFLCVVTYFIWAASEYWNYAMIAKSTVPIMDYWQWIATYGQRVLDGTISFSDYFNSDLGEHIQPIGMAINFGMLRANNFNVAPMIEWGVFGRIIVAGLVCVYFLWCEYVDKKQSYLLLGISAVAIIASVLNYNQWEMTIEPFSIGCIFRIFCYLLSFLYVDFFVNKIESQSICKNILRALLFGIYCGFLTLFVGAAYFVGHLMAIGLTSLYVLWIKRKSYKVYLYPMAVWAIVSFISACVYYYLVSLRGVSVKGDPFTVEDFLVLLQAICYFWGGLLIHNQTMEQYGNMYCLIIGMSLLIYIICNLIRYLRYDKSDKKLFPVACILYALSLSVAISFGRISRFDPSYLASSRYTIESSIGLVGVVWMGLSLARNSQSRLDKAVYGLSVCIILLLLSNAANVEQKIAPYRKIYNDNLTEMMIDIDDYPDEALAPFQASSPDYVRDCVAFFKENNLSIFSESDF